MEIYSPAFENNTFIPSKYTCDGLNINPPLKFKDIPDEVKTLVLIVDDPDAPSKTWIHWILWNINPKTTEIDENSHPKESLEGISSFGKKGYGGPCPPSGTHRYFFKLYALDKTIDLRYDANIRDIENAMGNQISTRAELIGLYKRK
jgi:Raf kinase inhibitor-like YbhB/YbcL family protein